MGKNECKNAGYALLLGSFFMIVTMVLHPVGGSFDHIVKILPINITAHVIAIMSIPFTMYGFWGFYRSHTEGVPMATLAFITTAIALLAGLIAGALNGLALSIFVNAYRDATPETVEAIKPILRYNGALNHAFDYILIGGLFAAVQMWSLVILKNKKYPVWLAYLGFLLGVALLGGLIAQFNFVNVSGFRLFIFGLVGWLMSAGFLMIRGGKN